MPRNSGRNELLDGRHSVVLSTKYEIGESWEQYEIVEIEAEF